MYFCSVDIRHCYDNIQVDHLLSLLETAVLQEKEYIIQKYFVAFPNHSVKKRIIVSRPGDYQPFQEGLKTWQEEFDHGVFIDGVQQHVVSSKDIMETIRSHFETNTVVIDGRYGDRYFRQVKGIPQGSIISTLCCNVYYGDMEKHLGVEGKTSLTHSLLARMMDDFLLITTDPNERTQFLDRMSKGIPSKGVEIHPDKTQVSDDHTVWFSWCGFLFDATNGSVKLDYSRFYDGIVSGSLTVDFQNPGAHLQTQQLQTFCRPRCIPLLFDSAINSVFMRFYNFYQLIGFAAVKTMHYDSLRFTNEAFLSKSIEDVIRFSYRLIQIRLKDYVVEPFLGSTQAMWIGRKAWNDVARYCGHSVTLTLPTLSSRDKRSKLENIAVQAWHGLGVDRLMNGGRNQ